MSFSLNTLPMFAYQECLKEELVRAAFDDVNLPADNYAYLVNGIIQDLWFTGMPVQRCLETMQKTWTKVRAI